MSGAARAANSIVLPAEQSAALRDRLVSEIAGLAIAGQRGRLGQGSPSSQEHAHRSRCKIGGNRICPEAIRFLAITRRRTVAAGSARRYACGSRCASGSQSSRCCRTPQPERQRGWSMRPAGSTRACSPSARRSAIATRSTCDLWPNNRACCAAASPRTPITSDLCSRARLAARRAMNSPSRSAARITARFIAPATRKPGGSKPASIRSRSPASFGNYTRMDEPRIASAAPTQDAAAERPAESERPSPGETSDSLATAWQQQHMLTAIGLCGDLFHTAAGTAFADIPVNGHRETWPIRSKRFRSWLRRCHYQATGEAASAAAHPLSARSAWKRGRNSMVRSARSTSASPSMPDASISISPMSTGARSKSDRTDGG